MEWMKFKKNTNYLQTRLALTTPLKLETQNSMTHCEINLCKKNRIDQCRNEKSACECGLLV